MVPKIIINEFFLNQISSRKIKIMEASLCFVHCAPEEGDRDREEKLRQGRSIRLGVSKREEDGHWLPAL
jgi:hypothetical protein